MSKKKMTETRGAAKPKYLTRALRCPDGTRKYIRGKTQEELDRKVRQAQAELGLGININDNTTVAEFAQIWLDVYKRPSVKPQTVEHIVGLLNAHILPVIGAMRVRDVRPADCARVLSQSQNLARATQDRVRSRMKEMFECARENRIVYENPVTRGVKASGRGPAERVPLSPEQLEAVANAALSKGDEALYTFILLCGYAGLRASEALGLHTDNVDTDAGVIYVREQYDRTAGTTPVLKTESSRRDVPMPPVLLLHMTRLKRVRPGYLFPVQTKALYASISKRLARLCSVDKDGSDRVSRPRQGSLPFYVHPHLLRHTYATICFESGLDIKEVQYLLGHSTPKMTMEVYTHYVQGRRMDDTSRKLAEAFPLPKVASLG